MKITKEAIELFSKMLKDNHMDLVVISLIDEGDETAIHVELATKDEIKDKPIISFDTLNVAISEEDQHALEDVTFLAEGDDIVIELPHHHHDDECCCGHHHEHEEGHHCCCEDHEEGEEHHCCCCEE
jgi:hypothetical protein